MSYPPLEGMIPLQSPAGGVYGPIVNFRSVGQPGFHPQAEAQSPTPAPTISEEPSLNYVQQPHSASLRQVLQHEVSWGTTVAADPFPSVPSPSYTHIQVIQTPTGTNNQSLSWTDVKPSQINPSPVYVPEQPDVLPVSQISVDVKPAPEPRNFSNMGLDPGPPVSKIACCLCCPPLAAQEQKRKVLLQSWVTVWSGNQHSLLTGSALVGLRCILFLATLFILIWSIIESRPDQGKYLIYLTNWDLVLQCFCFLLAVFATMYATRRYHIEANRFTSCPAWIHMAWTTYSVTMCTVFLVDILYWALLWDGGNVKAITIFTHGINFIWMLIEFIVGGQLIPLVHMALIFVYGAAFVAWSVIFWLLQYENADGKTYIYGVLDWTGDRKKASGYALGVIFIGLPIVTTFWSLLSEVRLRIFTRIPIKLHVLPE